jgi:hypothetical protein
MGERYGGTEPSGGAIDAVELCDFRVTGKGVVGRRMVPGRPWTVEVVLWRRGERGPVLQGTAVGDDRHGWAVTGPNGELAGRASRVDVAEQWLLRIRSEQPAGDRFRLPADLWPVVETAAGVNG